MIITGRNPVFEALSSGNAKKIFVRHGASVHFDKVDVPFEVLGRKVFEERFGTETQGVAALIDDFEYADLNKSISAVKNEKGIVFLDKIQDPHNFGAIIRAAHCFGINYIIVPRHDQAKVTQAVYKSSAGAIFYVNIIEVVNLGQAVDTVKSLGFEIAAAHMNGDTRLDEAVDKIKYPLGIIIGSEGRGIRESILEKATIRLNIPMNARIDSLNASMSAAVIFYQLFSGVE